MTDSVQKIIGEMRTCSADSLNGGTWADRLEALCKEPSQECWLVLDGDGQPIFCTDSRDTCHEHINDAISYHGIDGAGKWTVRRAYFGALAAPPARVDDEVVEALRTIVMLWDDRVSVSEVALQAYDMKCAAARALQKMKGE